MNEYTFFAAIFGIFCLGPIIIFLLIKKFVKPKWAKVLLNIGAFIGISVSAWMVYVVYTAEITGSGGLAILVLLPCSGLLAVTSLAILFFTNRPRAIER